MKPSGTGRTAYKRKKWNILFIGEDGKVIPVKHFKGIVTGLTLLFITLAMAMAVLFYSYRNRTEKMQVLQHDMAGVVAENRSLKGEKDKVLARLVILESRLKAQPADEPAPGAGKAHESVEPQKDPADKAKATVVSRKKTVPKAVGTEPGAGGQSTVPTVNITNENLVVCHDPDSEFVRVEYKVINMGAKDTPVSGRSVIVLKNGDMNPEDWIVLPNVPLSDLKPAGESGKRFRIYNFRTLKYKVKSSALKGRLENATIFTYTIDGRLLMEREYPLKMSAEMCP